MPLVLIHKLLLYDCYLSIYYGFMLRFIHFSHEDSMQMLALITF